MIAIVVATGLGPQLEAFSERYPPPMLPLVDRPFVQHVVEALVEQGIHQIDFILCHLPEKIEHFLGDGARWGCSFRFHLTRDPAFPYESLPNLLPESPGDRVLLGHADRLPQMNLRDVGDPSEPLAFCGRDDDGRPRWSGWAVLPMGFLRDLPGNLDEDALAQRVMAAVENGGGRLEVPAVLDIRSYRGLLDAHRKVLAKEFQGLFLSGREVDEGIWLSRNVMLHPTARLQPPVYIGENCRIESHTQLGPCAVIGRNCVLGSASTVEDSVVFPGSYVGEALELKEVLVDRNRLINVRMDVAVSITDEFILGGLSAVSLQSRLMGLVSRTVGALLLALFSPVLLATAAFLRVFRRGPVLFKRKVVGLPTTTDSAQWRTFEQWSFEDPEERSPEGTPWKPRDGLRHFLLRFLPGLVNVVRGEMRLVGVSPRTSQEILKLGEDWKALYLRTKAGLITESFVQYGNCPTEDELYSAEAFYSAMGGFIYDLKLTLGYIERVLGKGSPSGDEG